MNNNDTDNPSVTVLAEAGGVALVRVEGNVRSETRQPYNVAGKLTHTLAAAPAKLTIVNLCCQTTLQYDHLAFTTCRYDLHARTCVNTTPRGGSLTAPPQLFAHFYDRLEAIQSISETLSDAVVFVLDLPDEIHDPVRRAHACDLSALSTAKGPRFIVFLQEEKDRVEVKADKMGVLRTKRLRGGDGYSHEDVVGLFSCPSSIPIVVGPPMKKETRSDQSSFLQMLFGAHVISSSTSHASRELTIRLPSSLRISNELIKYTDVNDAVFGGSAGVELGSASNTIHFRVGETFTENGLWEITLLALRIKDAAPAPNELPVITREADDVLVNVLSSVTSAIADKFSDKNAVYALMSICSKTKNDASLTRIWRRVVDEGVSEWNRALNAFEDNGRGARGVSCRPPLHPARQGSVSTM